MIAQSKCQFCKVDLQLEIDDSYAALGDPYGLLKLASCNRCSSLRERRRKLHEAFSKTCAMLIATPKDPEVRNKALDVFTALTKKYVGLIAEWNGLQLAWEETMVDPFMARPDRLGNHIKHLWYLGKQQQFGI